MGENSGTDKDLASALKAAKTKRMFFAMVAKGGSDGCLIVSKTKVPASQIAEAKKKSGGTAVIRGVVYGQDGQLVFETAGEAPATAEKLAKKLAKESAGMSINPVFQVNESLADEEGGEDEGAEGNETASGESGDQVASKPASVVAYTKARLSWNDATQAVYNDLDQLSSKLGDEFPDEEEMMSRVVQAIVTFLEQFEVQLNEALDDALNATDDTARQAEHKKVIDIVEQYRKFVAVDPLVKQIKANPFVSIDLQAHLDKSLNTIRTQLLA